MNNPATKPHKQAKTELRVESSADSDSDLEVVQEEEESIIATSYQMINSSVASQSNQGEETITF